MGNELDNPKGIKEIKWNLSKIKFIFKYKDLTKITKFLYLFNYINSYFLIHFFSCRFCDYKVKRNNQNADKLYSFLTKKFFINKYCFNIYQLLNKRVNKNYKLNFFFRIDKIKYNKL